MIVEDMFVDFKTYCATCKHEKEKEETFETCAECLEYPVNANSVKPVNWEAKDE